MNDLIAFPAFVALSLLGGVPALAQSSAITAQNPSSIPVQPDHQTSCEVHVWPTRNGVANIQGAASLLPFPIGLMVDGAAHKEANKKAGAIVVGKIPPDAQLAAMERSDVKSALGLPTDTRVIAEETLPTYDEAATDKDAQERLHQMGAALSAKARLSPSQSPCYAELLVSGVAYARSPLDAPVLAVRWIFRDWRNGKILQAVGWRRQVLPGQPISNQQIEAYSDQTFRNLYSAALVQWASKKVKN